MDKIWSWILNLPSPSNWPPSTNPPPSLTLASSPEKFILFQADRTDGSDALINFSISLHGFYPKYPSRTLWVSDPFSLSSPSISHLLLLRQLLHEIVSLSPSVSYLNSNPLNLDQEVISKAVNSVSETEASGFFSLSFLLRLFFLCAIDAPSEAGFVFFSSLGETISSSLNCTKAISYFLQLAGPDVEQRYIRSLGYMLSKWCLLREIQLEPAKSHVWPVPSACFSYATSLHGLIILKGYAPVLAMSRTRSADQPKLDHQNFAHEPQESALKYSLAHQQFEVIVRLEYTVCMRDPRFIKVEIRVDNICAHVVKLGYRKKDIDESEIEEEEEEVEIETERHFPSRVRVWIGPEPGSAYATGPSLGRSSGNPEREVETMRTIKGGFSNAIKTNGIKAKVRSSARTKNKSWRWEQETDGSAAIFEGILCDSATWTEVATWKPVIGSPDPRTALKRRWRGPGRAFSRKGGLVVAGDELAEPVTWRVGREMEGRRVTWRVGGRFWVSYFANEVKSGYYETRCVEWNQEVQIALE
ncbi:hypothetical protein LUZ60_006407 [Juncus effusus]|nr:hypothetical protein LUZ60_006407 [Juncus effusus]